MLYIDPVTAVMFRDASDAPSQEGTTLRDCFTSMAGSPDFEPKFPLRSKDYDQAMAFMEEHSSEMLERHSSRAFADYDRVLQDMRSVMALYGWIDEWREEQLLTRLGVEPGDMHRAVDNADWLLHCLGELSKLFKVPEMVRQADVLRRRVDSGVSEELVELTTLQGVGRVRARALYTAGLQDSGGHQGSPGREAGPWWTRWGRRWPGRSRSRCQSTERTRLWTSRGQPERWQSWWMMLVGRAVGRELIVAVAFSGGLDSSVVAKCAMRYAKVVACTAFAPGAGDAVRARDGAAALGIELVATELTKSGVEKELASIDLPFEPDLMDRSLWCLYSTVSRSAKEAGSKVLLLGQMADELFGGYAKYAETLRRRGRGGCEEDDGV